MKNLYVRIDPRHSAKRFYRCGIAFSQAWLLVRDLDDATAKRLDEEQMLEVTETRPAELNDDEPAGDSAVTVSSSVSDSTPPADAAAEAAAAEAAAAEAAAAEAAAAEAAAAEAAAAEAAAAEAAAAEAAAAEAAAAEAAAAEAAASPVKKGKK